MTLYTHACIYNVFGCNATKEKKKEKELYCDQRDYTHIPVYIMSLVAISLFFLSFFVELWPKILYSHIQYVYIMSMVATLFAGRILFIILNQAASRTKFGHGPDLARGPDFGHAWVNPLLRIQLVYNLFTHNAVECIG